MLKIHKRLHSLSRQLKGVIKSCLFYNMCHVATTVMAYAVVRKRRSLLAIVCGYSAVVVVHRLFFPTDYRSLMKFLCEVPFGLGSIALFHSLPADERKRHLNAFTRYVNGAVLGNVVMMIFVPRGNTIRGLTSRMTCLLLSVWLMQEMRRVGWKTLSLDKKGIFLFHAAPLSWVFCQAAYRIALMSLPTFDSLKYLSLEPCSLLLMVSLYQKGAGYPLASYFGYADTLTIATACMVAEFFRMLSLTFPGLAFPRDHRFQSKLDRLFVPVHCAVSLYAGLALRGLSRRSKGQINPKLRLLIEY